MTSFGEYPTINAPFGSEDSQIEIPSSEFGFSSAMSVPVANGGTRITRHQMNGAGYLATLGAFLDRLGYPYGHKPIGIGTSNDGYPKGAIVTQFTDDGELREWINQEDNNTQYPPERVILDNNQEVNGWRPLWRMNQFNFFPDYSNKKLLKKFEFTPSQYSNTVEVPSSTPGWILVRRTIENWDDLSPYNKFIGVGLEVELVPYLVPNTADDNFAIQMYEGKVATRLLPCSTGVRIHLEHFSNYISQLDIEVFLYEMEE